MRQGEFYDGLKITLSNNVFKSIEKIGHKIKRLNEKQTQDQHIFKLNQLTYFVISFRL